MADKFIIRSTKTPHTYLAAYKPSSWVEDKTKSLQFTEEEADAIVRPYRGVVEKVKAASKKKTVKAEVAPPKE